MLRFRTVRPIFKNLSAPLPYQDLSRYVLELRTNKTLSSAAGTWEVTLVPHPNLDQDVNTGASLHSEESMIYRMVHPQDIVVLGVEAPDPNGVMQENIFMFGFVDQVFKSKSQRGQSTSRSIICRGRDGTKAFIVDQVALAPELASDPKVKQAFAEFGKKSGDPNSTPARLAFLDFVRGATLATDGTLQNVFIESRLPQAFYWILANIPATRINVSYFNTANRPVDIFQAFLTARKDDVIYDSGMNMYAGPVMNYLEQLTDKIFYECYVDTLPHNSPLNTTGKDRPILILRPKPYDHVYEVDSEGLQLSLNGVAAAPPANGFDAISQMVPMSDITLPTWETLRSPITGTNEVITEEEILQKGLGISDHEVFTMYKLFGELDLLSATPAGRLGYYFPLLDIGMLDKYGLREIQGKSKMIGYPSDFPRAIVKGLRNQLADEDFEKVTNLGGIGFVPKAIADRLPANPTALDVEQAITDRSIAQTTPLVSFMTKDRRDRLWRWNRYNHFYESGPITIQGRNVFVGTKLLLIDEESRYTEFNTPRNKDQEAPETLGSSGMEFYCVGVSHAAGFGRNWTTSLQCTRGHNPRHLKAYHDARFFDKPIGDFNDMLTTEAFRQL